MGKKSTKEKKAIPSITAVRKLIREIIFNPREDKSVAFILEVSNDEQYLLGKIIEYIRLSANATSAKDRRASLIMAMRLILIHLFYHVPAE